MGPVAVLAQVESSGGIAEVEDVAGLKPGMDVGGRDAGRHVLAGRRPEVLDDEVELRQPAGRGGEGVGSKDRTVRRPVSSVPLPDEIFRDSEKDELSRLEGRTRRDGAASDALS